jgi:hypothetical protein
MRLHPNKFDKPSIVLIENIVSHVHEINAKNNCFPKGMLPDDPPNMNDEASTTTSIVETGGFAISMKPCGY